MICNYRVVLVLDGGDNSLLVPCIGLNYLSEHLHFFDEDIKVNQWLDAIVSTGDSTLIGALLAENKKELFETSLRIERILEKSEIGYSDMFTEQFFNKETTLQSFKKHYMFVSYDMDMDESFVFSSMNPVIQTAKVNEMLKATTGDPFSNQYLKFGTRKLSNASYFIPTPIQHASNFANCLYFDDPVIFVSIGAGENSIENDRDNMIREIHEEFEKQVRNSKKWHYFRFNPVLPVNCSIEEKIQLIENYFEKEAPFMDRLLRLMEIKAGNIF